MSNSIRKGFYCIITLVVALFFLVFSSFALYLTVRSIDSNKEAYNYTLKSVEDDINKSIKRMINVNENIIYNDNIQQLLNENDPERIRNIRDIDNMLSLYQLADENLKFFAFCDMNDKYYGFLSETNDVVFSITAKKTLKDYKSASGTDEFVFFELSLGDDINRYVAVITPIYKIDNTSFSYRKQIGKAISIYSQESLLQSMRFVSYKIVDKIELTDSENIIRLTQSPENYGEKIDASNYPSKIALKYGGLNLFSRPKNLHASDFSDILIFMLIMILVVLFISLLIINNWFKRYILSDVNEILSVLADNQNGSAKKRITLKHNNEFYDIAENINVMLDSIEEYNRNAFKGQQKLYEMEIQLNKIRINMLKGQVNPHFLYNTLGCIRSMALEKGLDNIANISDATIDLLRYNLKEKEYVSLRREIEECKKYIKIINARYEGIITFRSQADNEALDTQVLKMIIQPILENSVYHGLSSSDVRMVITISAYVHNDVLFIAVTDDGKGMSEDRLMEVNRIIKNSDDISEHIGLHNVHKRIVMEYGEEYGIDIVSEERKGCTVNLRIPVKKNNFLRSGEIEEQ